MKKILVLTALLILVLTACGTPKTVQRTIRSPRYGGHSEETCELNWDHMDVEPGDEGTIVSLILNRNHAPDSVGATLKECIEDGWTGWR